MISSWWPALIAEIDRRWPNDWLDRHPEVTLGEWYAGLIWGLSLSVDGLLRQVVERTCPAGEVAAIERWLGLAAAEAERGGRSAGAALASIGDLIGVMPPGRDESDVEAWVEQPSAPCFAVDGLLLWDRALPCLAARPLAADVAREHGLLVVVAGSAEWGARSGVGGFTIGGSPLIVLMAGPVEEMTLTAWHELAHRLDPALPDESLCHHEYEVYAETLTSWMADHRPTSMAECVEGMALAEEARSRLRDGHPPYLPAWWDAPTWWSALFGGGR